MGKEVGIHVQQLSRKLAEPPCPASSMPGSQNQIPGMRSGTGGQGTPHLQGYLRADKQIYYNTLRSRLKCYWAVAEGSEEQNIRYCTKENGPKFEAGTPQTQAAKALRDRDQRVLDMQRDVVALPWEELEAKYPWETTYRGHMAKVEIRAYATANSVRWRPKG